MTSPPPQETAASRRARRQARRRSRTIKVTALTTAIVVLAAGAAAAWLLRDEGEAQVAPTTTTTTTAPAPEFEPYVTATSTVPEITAYEAPADDAPVVETFEFWTEYAVERTFLVIDEQPEWLQVLLPMRPNESTGWIRASEVELGETSYEITVDLSTTVVTVLEEGEVVIESESGIGKDNTPTPEGRYYVTDPVDLTDQPNGAYGAYALGISGYSEVLLEFNGGPGQVALHGTTNPADLGEQVSAGCIRLTNEIIFEIAALVPVGTPVTIVA